ncbi:hypothetical protein V8C35DRAFT_307037 [Trichoderma chlorosporum]
MSSLLSSSSTSIDTQSPTPTSFLNTSSIINRPSSISSLSSSSIKSGEPTKGSSDDVALDATPSTTQIAPTQSPSITASDLKTKHSPTATSQDASVIADGETASITLPTASSGSSKASLLTSATSISQSTSISVPLTSPTLKLVPQIVTVTRVPTDAIPTAAASHQRSSSITISSQTQVRAPTPQPSSQDAPASSADSGKESPSPTPAESPSVTPSQVQSSAAQPTDDSVQGPQVFSAADVAPPPEASSSSSIISTSSTASIQASTPSSAQGQQSQTTASQQANPVVSTPGGAGVSSTPISKPASTPASTPVPAPSSISSPTPAAGAASVPSSATTLVQASVPTVLFSNSILSGLPSSTFVDATPSSTGSFTTLPTDINTLPGDFRESGLPGGSQPTAQPIADPVSSSSRPSTSTIVGGTIGGIAAAAVIVILLWFWRRKMAGGRRGSSKAYTEKDPSKPMAQRLGIATTLSAVKQNMSEKFAPRNVNMNRGNSQFLEADATQPRDVAPMRNGRAQKPVAAGGKPKRHKLAPGLSFDFGRRFNPFSDANALMSGTVPPPSSSVLSNPFSDDNMVLPPPVSAPNRRSRGRSLGGIRSFQAPPVPPRPHSLHRESLQSNDSFTQRRDKFRSDPFDLELESQLAPPANGIPSRSSSVYSNHVEQNPRDSYTSKYVSGSSLGDWTAGRHVGSDGPSGGRRDSPTIS